MTEFAGAEQEPDRDTDAKEAVAESGEIPGRHIGSEWRQALLH